MNTTKRLAIYVSALRLPFISVTVFAFVFGSLVARAEGVFSLFRFLVGLITAVSMHLAANVFNDYADSRLGADWVDTRPYVFFGGSKLIQQGILPDRFFRYMGVIFLTISLLGCVALSAFVTRRILFISFFVIAFLSVAYSVPPFRFVYRRLGEGVIFILFGPALVMGAYFLQTQIFPSRRLFLMSLPFGILTAAILFVNEVPDYATDKQTRKRTLVDLMGPQRAYIIYDGFLFCAAASICSNVVLGNLSLCALYGLLLLIPGFIASMILRDRWQDKVALVQSSKLTIFIHALVSIVLIIGILI